MVLNVQGKTLERRIIGGTNSKARVWVEMRLFHPYPIYPEFFGNHTRGVPSLKVEESCTKYCLQNFAVRTVLSTLLELLHGVAYSEKCTRKKYDA